MDTTSRAASSWSLSWSQKDTEEARAALKTLAALRCVSSFFRELASKVPVTVAAAPSPELARWLRGLTVQGLHLVPPGASQGVPAWMPGYAPWMPGYSVDAWLSRLHIQGDQALRQVLQQNLETLADSLRVLTGVPLSSDLPIVRLRQLRRLALVNSGDEEVLRLKPLASLTRLEEVSARGYYQYNLTGLPPSVKRLHLHWEGGGGRLRMPPGVALDSLFLEGVDLFIPHAVLIGCKELLVHCFAAFVALPPSPLAEQPTGAATARWLTASMVALDLYHFMDASPCRRLEVLGNLLRVVVPCTEVDYDFRSGTVVAGQCDEEGGAPPTHPPSLKLSSALAQHCKWKARVHRRSALKATPSIREHAALLRKSVAPALIGPSPVAPRPARSVSAQASATPAAPAPESQGIKWGADLKKLATCVGLAAVVWFIPPPAGVTTSAWHLLAIFLGTIAGIITQPLPLGAVAMLGLGATMVTKTLTFAAAFSAFASEIPWLIAIAFWLSGGFIRSGLGARIAYSIVSLFGKTTLGLTYSLVFAEALLAPAIPSVAARAGGLFLPLAKALCLACGSDPNNGTEKRMGSYLMMTCFLTTTISSAMFITAMAANPLAVNLATEALGQTISWGTWATAGLVPGLVCLVLTPLLLYIIYPPEVKDTPDAPAKAKEELKKLGPMSTDEKITAFAFAITVGLWIFGASVGVNAVAAALVGLAILLVTGVVSWKQCLSDNQAWDTLTWFAALIAMAAYLNKFGFISWFSDQVVGLVSGLGLGWQPAFGLILTLYFYSHYFFASGAAHIGAMYTAFISVAVACGTPGLLAALALGQLSNVMGCLTTYGIGSAPPYYGAGYVPQSKWYQFGFLFSVIFLAVWVFIGGAEVLDTMSPIGDLEFKECA
ncbi:hypothetical protein N2152v2_010555 [Parachlorella kessleri]